MAIQLVRVDFRLVHGQVVTKWIHTIKADTILVVNDKLANDPFMLSVYQMSAPMGTKVDVIKVDDFIAHWKENKYEDVNCMVLIKNVEDIVCLKKGLFLMPFKSVLLVEQLEEKLYLDQLH